MPREMPLRIRVLSHSLWINRFGNANNTRSGQPNYFKTRQTRNTRAGDIQLEIPNIKTTTGRKAFLYGQHWHNLPVNSRTITSKQLFKQECIKNIMRDINHPIQIRPLRFISNSVGRLFIDSKFQITSPYRLQNNLVDKFFITLHCFDTYRFHVSFMDM